MNFCPPALPRREARLWGGKRRRILRQPRSRAKLATGQAEGQSRKFFFLKGKIKKGRGAPKKEWKNFLLCSPQGERRRWAGLPPCGRRLSSVLLEKGSSGVVKLHQNLTFGKLTDFFVGGAQRRPLILRRCAREARGQTEVRYPLRFCDSVKEEKEKGYGRKEIRKGSFERMVRLPAPVKETKVDAIYEKGVLKITMPKAKTEPKPKVPIKVKEK